MAILYDFQYETNPREHKRMVQQYKKENRVKKEGLLEKFLIGIKSFTENLRDNLGLINGASNQMLINLKEGMSLSLYQNVGFDRIPIEYQRLMNIHGKYSPRQNQNLNYMHNKK